jgi:putative two-component system response regulator
VVLGEDDGALTRLGYDVHRAPHSADVPALLAAGPFDAAVVHVDALPVDGLGLVHRLLEGAPDTAVLILSATESTRRQTEYLHAGAAGYLVWPADKDLLEPSLQRALRSRGQERERHLRESTLRDELADVIVRLRLSEANVARVSVGMLDSLVRMMELRDRYLAGHSMRVAHLAASLAAEFGKRAREVETVRAAGRLHDIGMLCIGDGILSKQGPLTAEEFAQVQQHVTIGDELLRQLPRLEKAAQFVRHHHERWDGGGYPDGLRGDAIPWGAQLIGTAEVYDALTTARAYKSPLPAEAAVEQLQDMRGSALSPDVCDALSRLVRRGHALVFIDSEHQVGPLAEAPVLPAAGRSVRGAAQEARGEAT